MEGNSKLQHGNTAPTSHSASIENADLKLFIAAGSMEASFLDKITKNKCSSA